MQSDDEKASQHAIPTCPLSFVDVPVQDYVEGILGGCTFNQIDLLQDVFTWAYNCSCLRYLAITQTTADPDPFDIRYREALILAVQTVVRDGDKLLQEEIEQFAGTGSIEKFLKKTIYQQNNSL